MRLIVIASLLVVLLSGSLLAEREAIHDWTWYVDHYPYMKYRGRVFSFETEFNWPDGYDRPDSVSLTPYQFWVSNMPLWHAGKAPNSLKSGVLELYGKYARAVHLPWRDNKFDGATLVTQILFEYLVYSDQLDGFGLVPLHGDTLTYHDWLRGVPKKYAHKGLVIEPNGETRQSSNNEIDAFLNFFRRQSTFASIASNFDTIAAEKARPGDFMMCYDEAGLNGRAFVLLAMIENDDGDRLFAVGTGCENYCDFYIPDFNGDRQNPWISIERLQEEAEALAEDYPVCYFYRPRIP